MWMLKSSETRSARWATRRGLRPGCELLEGRALLATFQVADVAGLQAAVADVNANPSQAATINLAAGTYDLVSELQVVNASHLTIQGDPSGNVVIDNPTHSDRIFEVDSGNMRLDGLIIRGGSASVGGGIYAYGGSLIVKNSTFFANSAWGGGAIYANGTALTVDHSTISGNSATDYFQQYDGYGGYGGGILAVDGTLTVYQSTISGNSGFHGGGICAFGYFGAILASFKNNTISSNTANGGYGGGIYAFGSAMTVDHCELSNNSAGQGGGIYASGFLTVENSMFSANSASSGSGIYAYYATVGINDSTLNDSVGGEIVNDNSAVHLKKTVVDGVLYVDQDYS